MMVGMGLAEDAYDRLRRVAFEGEHLETHGRIGGRRTSCRPA